MSKTKYEVKVTATKTGYKVQVKTDKISKKQDLKADFNPVKFLTGKKDFFKISAGKMKTNKQVIDTDEFEFDLEKWEQQVPKWCELEGFDQEVVKEIEKEIKKIIMIKNL